MNRDIDKEILFCEGIGIRPPSLLSPTKSAFERMAEYSASSKPAPEWGYPIPVIKIEMHGSHPNHGMNVRKGRPPDPGRWPHGWYFLPGYQSPQRRFSFQHLFEIQLDLLLVFCSKVNHTSAF